ncbi:MAG: hypothetical protein ACK5LC_14050 [Coprobacillaceae bacterium]
MEYDEKLQWLKSYKTLHDKLTYINNRIKGVQAINYTPGENGPGKSINELIDEKTMVIAKMEEIEDAIENIEDETLSTILGYRFLLFYTLVRTSIETGYSLSQINRKQKEAIEILKDDTK